MVGENGKKSRRRLIKSRYSWTTGLSILALSLAAPAADFSYVCEKSGLTRSIEVVTQPGYACRVRYKKSSGTTYPWNARNQADYCRPRAEDLLARLISWGWQCDSNEDVGSILSAQLERYQRHLKILGNVGKTCHLYPSEMQFGNLCGDERHEGVIVYTCDSDADNWEQHLAVFLELENEPMIREVGDSKSRQVTAWHIDERKLVLETQSLTANGEDEAPGEALQFQCRLDQTSGWILDEK